MPAYALPWPRWRWALPLSGVLACAAQPQGAARVPISSVTSTPPAAPAGASNAADRSGLGAPRSAAPARLLRRSYRSPATAEPRGYLLYQPQGYDPEGSRAWPVLLFLHGNGERGDGAGDLDYLLKNGPLFEAWIQKRDLPFLIVAPQLPMYGRDEHADYLKNRTRAEIPKRLEAGAAPRPPEFETPGPMLGAVASGEVPLPPYGPPMGWPELEQDLLLILDEVLAGFRADADRQYITGVSYGGFGTWFLASRHPGRFAAMAPVVGYGHPELMPSLAKQAVPIWCFAGGRDGAVPLQYFYPGLNRLEALGHPEVRFSIEADMGHDVWARVYAGDDLYSWLLSHPRRAL